MDIVYHHIMSHFAPGRALSDGQCNLVQLTSEVKRVKKVDKDGKPLLVPEWPERSWETKTFGNMEVKRRKRRASCSDRIELAPDPGLSIAHVKLPSPHLQHIPALLHTRRPISPTPTRTHLHRQPAFLRLIPPPLLGYGDLVSCEVWLTSSLVAKLDLSFHQVTSSSSSRLV